MMMMMMNTTTTVITSRTKLPHININNRNYTNTITSCSDLLSYNPPKKMTMVHNNKYAAVFPPLSCLKKHHFNCEINTHDNVFNSTVNADNDEDNAFTAELDLSSPYAFTNCRVLPDYLPVTVSTSGFGNKIKLALGIESGMNGMIRITDLAETIGTDLVAMNFNHIVTSGAQPTLLLTSRTCPTKLREAMTHASLLCASKCGFSISFSDIEMKSRQTTSSIGYGTIESPIIDGKNIEVGDVLIGLPSNGVHSHGFSLIKRVIEQSGSSLKDKLPGDEGTLGESLMKPTTIYVKEVLDIISKSKCGVKGIAYIASGGFIKNVPKLFRSGLGAVIFGDSWPVPSIFKWIQEVGRIEDVEMRRIFNMGIGMVLVINKETASRILQESCCKHVYRIGEVVSGGGVTYR